jgi:hypothetical protein
LKNTGLLICAVKLFSPSFTLSTNNRRKSKHKSIKAPKSYKRNSFSENTQQSFINTMESKLSPDKEINLSPIVPRNLNSFSMESPTSNNKLTTSSDNTSVNLSTQQKPKNTLETWKNQISIKASSKSFETVTIEWQYNVITFFVVS